MFSSDLLQQINDHLLNLAKIRATSSKIMIIRDK